MKFLIFGANGYIGGYLYSRMRAEGIEVVGTGHCSRGAEGLVSFDAGKESAADMAKWMTGKERTAILCIAQTNIDRCKSEYEQSRQINVVVIKEMIKALIQEKYHIIYFSTDNVFDGVKGNYTEQDTTNAINQYGKMKEEIELFLAGRYPEVCIFRLPKVLGVERDTKNMLTDWEYKQADDEIRCIKNMKMSVVAKEDIYQACLISAERKMHGIYNLCSGETLSRKELAAKFFERLGMDNKKIVELDADKFGFLDIRPLNVSLDCSKFSRETGYRFRSYEMMIEQYLQYNKLNESRKEEEK